MTPEIEELITTIRTYRRPGFIPASNTFRPRRSFLDPTCIFESSVVVSVSSISYLFHKVPLIQFTPLLLTM